jgi:hypothetical protein
MATPGIASPAPRRPSPKRLWIWTACVALASFLDVAFAWEVNANPFGLLLTWALPVAVLLTFAWALVFAVRNRRHGRMVLAGVLAPVACVAVWAAASFVADKRVGWDFDRNYNERVQVVQMVMAGKLANDPRDTNLRRQPVLLPAEYRHLAHMDGRVFVDREPATHAITHIWFYEERPCPDCERGFVYAVSDDFDGANGMYEVTPLRPQWFWAVEVH